MKKQIFILSLLVALTAALTVGCVYEYKHHQNVTDAAVVKAQAQRTSALSELKTKTDQYTLNLQAAQGQYQGLVNEKNALCSQIKIAKLTSPYCQ